MTLTISKTQPLLLKLVAAALLAGSAAGCVPLVLGGAALGTALVATDRRTSGAQLEDEGIELRASNRLPEALSNRGHINVTSYNRQVLLTGEVPNEQDRVTAEEVVKRLENVRGIVNEIGVMGNSTLSQRSSDTLVTGQVKAALVDTRDLSPTNIKVVTERGTVYLLGRVTQREADRAADVVRGVNGVQKVVRVFEVISEEELRKLAPQPH